MYQLWTTENDRDRKIRHVRVQDWRVVVTEANGEGTAVFSCVWFKAFHCHWFEKKGVRPSRVEFPHVSHEGKVSTRMPQRFSRTQFCGALAVVWGGGVGQPTCKSPLASSALSTLTSSSQPSVHAGPLLSQKQPRNHSEFITERSNFFLHYRPGTLEPVARYQNSGKWSRESCVVQDSHSETKKSSFGALWCSQFL